MSSVLSTTPQIEVPPGSVQLSMLLGSFSYVLDLASGELPGHTLRSCILGMKLGKRIGLNAQELGALFYALLLKDIGASGNLVRDIRLPFSTSLEAALLYRNGPGCLPRRRILPAFADLVCTATKHSSISWLLDSQLHSRASREMYRAERRTLAAERLRDLGFGLDVRDTVLCADLKWGGGDQRGVPLLSQIIKVAQTLEKLHEIYGWQRTMEILYFRCKKWFDPRVVTAANLVFYSAEKWADLEQKDLITYVASLEPVPSYRYVGSDIIDTICTVFADVIDNRLESQAGDNSAAVSDLSERIARAMNVPLERLNQQGVRTLSNSAVLSMAG